MPWSEIIHWIKRCQPCIPITILVFCQIKLRLSVSLWLQHLDGQMHPAGGSLCFLTVKLNTAAEAQTLESLRHVKHGPISPSTSPCLHVHSHMFSSSVPTSVHLCSRMLVIIQSLCRGRCRPPPPSPSAPPSYLSGQSAIQRWQAWPWLLTCSVSHGQTNCTNIWFN